MDHVTFIDGDVSQSNLVPAAWLNDVNNLRYAAGSSARGAALLDYISSRVNAVSRSIRAMLDDYINVKALGVRGDGVTDDTAAIQAIINAYPGQKLWFPPGVYVLSDFLYIEADGTMLCGAGSSCTYIKQTGTNKDWVRYRTSTALITNFINNAGASGIYFYRSTAATSGAAIRATQLNGGMFEDIVVADAPEGWIWEGGQLNRATCIKLFASGAVFDLSGDATSALMHFREAPIDGGLYQPCYTVTLDTFVATASKKTFSIFNYANGDGINLVNGYAANGYYALEVYAGKRNGGNVSSVLRDSVYYDGVSTVGAGTQYLVYAPADAYASFDIFTLQYTNCIFGNAIGGFLGRKRIFRLSLSNCDFLNFTTWPIDVEGDVTYSGLIVNGCTINNCATSSGGAVRAKNQKIISYTGGAISNSLTGVAFSLGSSAYGVVTIDGVALSNVTNDISIAGSTFDSLVWGNCSSDVASPTASLRGLRIGNYEVTDSKVLDWYEEFETTTPTLTLGGGTSPTYAVQTLRGTRQGNRVAGEMHVQLSAKGASAGAALFLGLPYSAKAGYNSPVSVVFNSMTAGVGDTMIVGFVLAGTATIALYKLAGGSVTQLTNADFTDTSDVTIGFNYGV